MPRKEARFNLGIWQDPDWRRLPFAAQYLYKLLWTHPQLSYCGVTDWRSGRLAAMTDGLTSEIVQALGDCLEARYFIVRDDETEEVLLRSWVRWDGLMKQPRLAVSYANAYAAVASDELRAVIIHELIRLRERDSDLAGFGQNAIQEMIGLPSLDPKLRDTVRDPFTLGFGCQFGYGFGDGCTPGLGETTPYVSVPDKVPPTPSPSPSPLLQPPKATSPHGEDIIATPKPKKIAASKSDIDAWFTEWYDLYPVKKDRQAARTKYETVVKRVGRQTLLDGLRRFLAHLEENPDTFIKYPATWLNKGCWEDEYDQPRLKLASNVGPWTPEPPPREIADDFEACNRWYEEQAAKRRTS